MLPGGDELFAPCSSESLSDSISISKGSWQLAHTSADIMEGKFKYEKYSRFQTSRRILSNRDFFFYSSTGICAPTCSRKPKRSWQSGPDACYSFGCVYGVLRRSILCHSTLQCDIVLAGLRVGYIRRRGRYVITDKGGNGALLLLGNYERRLNIPCSSGNASIKF